MTKFMPVGVCGVLFVLLAVLLFGYPAETAAAANGLWDWMVAVSPLLEPSVRLALYWLGVLGTCGVGFAFLWDSSRNGSWPQAIMGFSMLACVLTEIKLILAFRGSLFFWPEWPQVIGIYVLGFCWFIATLIIAAIGDKIWDAIRTRP